MIANDLLLAVVRYLAGSMKRYACFPGIRERTAGCVGNNPTSWVGHGNERTKASMECLRFATVRESLCSLSAQLESASCLQDVGHANYGLEGGGACQSIATPL